jgi:antitoxin component of MazEF toxin-antitoxin module
MSLTDRNGSVGVTIPSGAVKILGYEIGEQREVQVYQSGVWVPREVPDE